LKEGGTFGISCGAALASLAAPESTQDALDHDLGPGSPVSCMPLLGGRYSPDRYLLLLIA